MNIDDYKKPILCKCGNDTFTVEMKFFKISNLVTATSQQPIILENHYKCSKCNDYVDIIENLKNEKSSNIIIK